MINNNTRTYNYFTFGDSNDYGQQQLSKDIAGSVKMAIYNLTNTITTNIKYKDSTYLGLTKNNSINDKWVIEYGDIKLKVMYVIPQGRYIQVFLGEL